MGYIKPFLVRFFESEFYKLAYANYTLAHAYVMKFVHQNLANRGHGNASQLAQNNFVTHKLSNLAQSNAGKFVGQNMANFTQSKSGKLVHAYAWKLVQMLRANPLGPALTVCLSGLLAVFVFPQLVLWLYFAPKLILTQVVLSAPIVPYCLYRIHKVPWKPLVGLWGAVYLLALLRTPQSLSVMPAFAISAHLSTYFIWGFLLSAGMGLMMGEKPKKVIQPQFDSVPRAS